MINFMNIYIEMIFYKCNFVTVDVIIFFIFAIMIIKFKINFIIEK